MAKYVDYIQQAKSNLTFLNDVNKHSSSSFDWQVTISFYVGVHLVNAFLQKERGMSFNSHTETFSAINFANSLSPYRFSEEDYLAYRRLYNLSRRSRYLCTDSDHLKGQDDSIAYLTHGVHLKRAVLSLEKLLVFICSKYHEKINPIELSLLEIQKLQFQYFKFKKA